MFLVISSLRPLLSQDMSHARELEHGVAVEGEDERRAKPEIWLGT